jgi:hypothetical protein
MEFTAVQRHSDQTFERFEAHRLVALEDLDEALKGIPSSFLTVERFGIEA